MFQSPLDPQAGWPGCYINGGPSMVLLQLKDSLELSVKRTEFLPGFAFLSRHDIFFLVDVLCISWSKRVFYWK